MQLITFDTHTDTYEPHQSEALKATVLRTAPLHGCVRRAVASAVTTAFVALGQDWTAEARVDFPDVYSELASESGPRLSATTSY